MLKKIGTLGRFERLQQGEAAEVVLAEATAAAAATKQTASVRTRPDSFVPSKKNKKVAEKKK